MTVPFRRVAVAGKAVAAVLSVLVLVVAGYGWSQYRDLTDGLRRSGALGSSDPRSAGGDTNILVMGLDSRLDESGNPLPPDIYDALHAGDAEVGGHNANVLMLVHLPGNGGNPTGISIPRDDYVDFPGTPDGMKVAFVRQRRDNVHPRLNFTDLDRERRQQAFIASLAHQLAGAGTLADPARLKSIIGVVQQNMAVDGGFDLLSLAQRAGDLAGGSISFSTLPIERFGKDPLGEDVNIVDPARIRAAVQGFLSAPTPGTDAPAAGAAAPVSTVDVVNGTGRDGLAATLQKALAGHGYTAGTASTDARHRATTSIHYGPGSDDAAHALAGLIGGPALAADHAVPAGHLTVLLGSDFRMPSGLAAGRDTGGAAARHPMGAGPTTRHPRAPHPAPTASPGGSRV